MLAYNKHFEGNYSLYLKFCIYSIIYLYIPRFIAELLTTSNGIQMYRGPLAGRHCLKAYSNTWPQLVKLFVNLFKFNPLNAGIDL